MKKAENVLKSVKKSIAIKNKEEHIPSEFFKDGPGLFIWNSFKENIVRKAKSTKAGAEMNISSFDLKKDSTDEEIEKSLPEKHIFSETEVCAVIAELIENQPKGKKGILQNTGYANLFYTPSRVVLVYWRGSRWFVGAWNRGFDWYVGLRVFSPATES